MLEAATQRRHARVCSRLNRLGSKLDRAALPETGRPGWSVHGAQQAQPVSAPNRPPPKPRHELLRPVAQKCVRLPTAVNPTVPAPPAAPANEPPRQHRRPVLRDGSRRSGVNCPGRNPGRSYTHEATGPHGRTPIFAGTFNSIEERMTGLEPTASCMASARSRSLPFAPVRSNRLLAALLVEASERMRTRANAEPCHSCHGFRRQTRSRAGRRTAPTARSLHGGERERDRLVWRELPALLPRLGEGRFVELRADCGERLFVHLRQP